MKAKGAKHPRWKGGKSLATNGRMMILVEGHPRAKNGRYVYEHILKAEKAVGHVLPAGVQVHHVNEDVTDNRGYNLVVCQDAAYHKLLHRRMNALRACGDPDAACCVRCKKHEPLSSLGYMTHSAKGYEVFEHRLCKQKHDRLMYTRRRGVIDE